MLKVFKPPTNLFEYAEQYKPIQTKSQLKYQKKFIEKAIKVHGDKYDYSKVNYKNMRTKITIICPIHGEFEQTPDSHIYGNNGCPKCGDVSMVNKRFNKFTTKSFIEKAIKVHGYKYDYSKVNYINNSIKIKIICSIHGEFEQTPVLHLRGSGCPKCGNYLLKNIKSSNTKEFIKKAKEIHGDKYDYSKVVYKNAHDKVTIICPIHGEFLKSPNNHLSKKQGCPICSEIKQLKNTNYTTGQYIPNNPEKYTGDINNIIYRSSYELKAFEMIEEDKNIISWESETIKIPYPRRYGRKNRVDGDG